MTDHATPSEVSPQPQSAFVQRAVARGEPQTEPAAEPYVFDLDGGRVCLDFANTLGSSPSSSDHLSRYTDLVAFAAQSALITPDEAQWLQAQADHQPVVAARVLKRAKRLRAAMQAIFSRLAAGKPLPESE